MKFNITIFIVISLAIFCVSCAEEGSPPEAVEDSPIIDLDPLTADDYLNSIALNTDADGVMKIATAHENKLEFFDDKSQVLWSVEQAYPIDLYLTGIWRGRRVLATGYADNGQINFELYDTSGVAVWFAGIKVNADTRLVLERPNVLSISDVDNDGLTEIIVFVPGWKNNHPGSLYCFGETGRLLWQREVFGVPTNFVLAPEDSSHNLLLFGFKQNRNYDGPATQAIDAPVAALDLHGNTLWQFQLNEKEYGADIELCGEIGGRPAICAGLYSIEITGTADGGLFRLDAGGVIRERHTESGAIIDILPGADDSGNAEVYAASATGAVYLFDHNLAVKSRIQFVATDPSPAIELVELGNFTGDKRNELLLYSTYPVHEKTHDYDNSGPDYSVSFTTIYHAIRKKLFDNKVKTPQTVYVTVYSLLGDNLDRIIERKDLESSWHCRDNHHAIPVVNGPSSPDSFVVLSDTVTIYKRIK